jgi:hypothetical protein
VRAPSALDGLDEDTGRLSPTAAFGDAEPDLAEQRAVDRQWYDDDEGGGHGEAFNPFAGDDSSYVKREVEMQKRLTRRDGSMMTLAQSKRHNQMHMDHTAWEENRLMTSGVARLREADMVRAGCSSVSVANCSPVLPPALRISTMRRRRASRSSCTTRARRSWTAARCSPSRRTR